MITSGWHSIALLGYDFFAENAEEHDQVKAVSLDRLVFSRVMGMDVQKYMDDLLLMKQYYLKHFHTQSYLDEAEARGNVWRENCPENK